MKETTEKSKGNTYLPFLAIVVIVAIVGIVVLVMNKGTAQVSTTGESSEEALAGQSIGGLEWLSCTDGDNGKYQNIYSNTTAYYNDVKNVERMNLQFDSCYSNSIVKERYCSGNFPAWGYLNCQVGSSCIDGECRRCTDSDGDNTGISGVVTTLSESNSDQCANPVTIYEYTCNSISKSRSDERICAGSCVDGACTGSCTPGEEQRICNSRRTGYMVRYCYSDGHSYGAFRSSKMCPSGTTCNAGVCS